jgi:hypothetical protein
VFASAPAEALKTVTVNCPGDKINQAIKGNDDQLVLEIRGFCDEDVIVDRNDVTLRGANPSTDGYRHSIRRNRGAEVDYTATRPTEAMASLPKRRLSILPGYQPVKRVGGAHSIPSASPSSVTTRYQTRRRVRSR